MKKKIKSRWLIFMPPHWVRNINLYSFYFGFIFVVLSFLFKSIIFSAISAPFILIAILSLIGFGFQKLFFTQSFPIKEKNNKIKERLMIAEIIFLVIYLFASNFN